MSELGPVGAPAEYLALVRGLAPIVIEHAVLSEEPKRWATDLDLLNQAVGAIDKQMEQLGPHPEVQAYMARQAVEATTRLRVIDLAAPFLSTKKSGDAPEGSEEPPARETQPKSISVMRAEAELTVQFVRAYQERHGLELGVTLPAISKELEAAPSALAPASAVVTPPAAVSPGVRRRSK